MAQNGHFCSEQGLPRARRLHLDPRVTRGFPFQTKFTGSRRRGSLGGEPAGEKHPRCSEHSLPPRLHAETDATTTNRSQFRSKFTGSAVRETQIEDASALQTVGKIFSKSPKIEEKKSPTHYHRRKELVEKRISIRVPETLWCQAENRTFSQRNFRIRSSPHPSGVRLGVLRRMVPRDLPRDPRASPNMRSRVPKTAFFRKLQTDV